MGSMSDKKEFGSAYLYAEDLIRDGNYIDATVTIESVIPPNTIKAANGKMIGHDTLKFVGKDKLLVLCAKVNQRILAIATGESQAEKWPGHKITLQVRIVDSFGEKVPAIRILPPQGAMIRKSLRERLGTKASLKNGGAA
jgi:hypothetical protein